MAFTKSIIRKEDSSNIVFDYKTRDFPLVTSPSASSFVAASSSGQPSDFELNPHVAQKSGIAKLQKDSFEAKIEEQALIQLKQVEEKAYKEAYDLGLIEGAENAFKEKQAVLTERVKHLDDFLVTLETLKQKILADHEAHIMKMIYAVASRIAMREIKTDPSSILPVVEQVIKDTQSDERLTVRISAEDAAFLESVKEKLGRTAESLRRVQLEVTEGIASGGCLLESNYGSIDATVEMRVERAWETLSERLPAPEQRTPTDGNSGESKS